MFTAAVICWFQHKGIWSLAFCEYQKWRDLIWCHTQPTLSYFKGARWTEITGLLTYLFCAAVNMLILLLGTLERQNGLYFSHAFTYFTNIICCFDNICSVSKHCKSERFSNKKPFTEPFQNQCLDFFFFFLSYEGLVSRGNNGVIIVWAATLERHRFYKKESTRTFHPSTQFIWSFPLYHSVAHLYHNAILRTHSSLPTVGVANKWIVRFFCCPNIYPLGGSYRWVSGQSLMHCVWVSHGTTVCPEVHINSTFHKRHSGRNEVIGPLVWGWMASPRLLCGKSMKGKQGIFFTA